MSDRSKRRTATARDRARYARYEPMLAGALADYRKRTYRNRFASSTDWQIFRVLLLIHAGHGTRVRAILSEMAAGEDGWRRWRESPNLRKTLIRDAEHTLRRWREALDG